MNNKFLEGTKFFHHKYPVYTIIHKTSAMEDINIGKELNSISTNALFINWAIGLLNITVKQIKTI